MSKNIIKTDRVTPTETVTDPPKAPTEKTDMVAAPGGKGAVSLKQVLTVLGVLFIVGMIIAIIAYLWHRFRKSPVKALPQ